MRSLGWDFSHPHGRVMFVVFEMGVGLLERKFQGK